ncbi:MAG: hypothetical protein V4685_15110 [Bacteroidota bacterium]
MRIIGLILTLFIYTSAIAQENSPYSRYGLGDILPGQSILNRSMGGIAAGFSDNQTVNFANPASYGNFNYYEPSVMNRIAATPSRTIFDFGFEINTRNLKQIDPAAKYTATNLIISYLQLGLPIRLRKANKKGVFLGVNFGLRPLSRINYKILTLERKDGVDSIGNLYEGSGGVTEALIGAGLRIKNFNVGFNTGYRFGNKKYSTIVTILNDSVSHYQSNSETATSFGGMFFTLGTQYEIKFKNKKDASRGSTLRLGAYASLKQTMNGSQDKLSQTVKYDVENGIYQIDSVFKSTVDGSVQYPLTWGAGFTYKDSSGHWTFGADYESTNWKDYRFFGQGDNVQNTWKIRAGAEYLPADRTTPIRKYFSFIKYRAGFYYGPSYVNIGQSMPEYAFSVGAGIPLKLRPSYGNDQYSYLNTTVEFGSRGDKSSNLRESFLRISFGLSLSDIWFNRSKYY